ncbi:MAG: electron transfer flavoprotein subunit beta [Negativicutes bacterium]|nr:electron transfer flavoprotein subunit beta [Negativicutes bacterium]
MKIQVLMKEILDQGGRYSLNPYDRQALEEALRLKATHGGEVAIVTLGRAEAEDTVRSALALGADRASLIIANCREAAEVSRLLAEHIRLEAEYDLILAGAVAVDDCQSQVPGRLSVLLGRPLVNNVSRLEITGNIVLCERESAGRREKVAVPLPAIVAVGRPINKVRLPAVFNIIKANRMPLTITIAPSHAQPEGNTSYELRLKKRRGVIVRPADEAEAVAFLIGALANEKLP